MLTFSFLKNLTIVTLSAHFRRPHVSCQEVKHASVGRKNELVVNHVNNNGPHYTSLWGEVLMIAILPIRSYDWHGNRRRFGVRVNHVTNEVQGGFQGEWASFTLASKVKLHGESSGNIALRLDQYVYCHRLMFANWFQSGRLPCGTWGTQPQLGRWNWTVYSSPELHYSEYITL